MCSRHSFEIRETPNHVCNERIVCITHYACRKGKMFAAEIYMIPVAVAKKS